MSVPYYKPFELAHRPHLSQRIADILDSRQFTKGNLSAKLALLIAERTHYKHGIPFSSGTAALFLLGKWYYKQGFRRIRVPAFTWPSTYQPFSWLGYGIKFVDINRETWLADFGDIKPDTNELDIPVDTFGNVTTLSTRLTDSAQSLGASWPHQEMGDRIVSLSGSKILTSGEGGILLTQDEELARFAWNQGWFSRLPELSAALGLAYLEEFDTILAKKKAIAEAYHEHLPDIQWQKIPHSTNDYIVAGLVDSPKAFAKVNPDFEMRFYYSHIVSETDDFVPFENAKLSLPNTEYVSRHIVALPSFPDMNLDDIKRLRMP